jgi:uncharacterized protein (TIGR00375 family)
MELVADLHLHSKYSRAVSQQMIIPEIARWARRKGLGLVGAPDWTQPLFFRELKESLVEVGEGIYAWKEDQDGPKFLLVTEIASIYSQSGRGRRIHNLVFAPSLETVEKINSALKNKGANLLSDGRPMISLSARDLTELVLNTDKNCLIIPAHAWTPWYSLYGSNSGFDSIKECFGEFESRIYAIETGLSSDPAMNWRVEELDSRAIVSFSDAHSPAKIGREATVFETEDIGKLRFSDIKEAILNQKIVYTIEFYPQEGKYHYTGHRKCRVKHSPEETKKLGGTCPVCGRRLTLGVMHRVEKLATRNSDEVKTKEVIIGKGLRGVGWQNRPPYVMLVPLVEILSESLKVGVSSQKVRNEYIRLTEELKSEFNVLIQAAIKEITKISGEKIAEGVKKVREGDLAIDPGYDGVFGTVKIWGEEEKESEKQMALF